MSKSRSKQVKLNLKTQNLPPTTLLRPRLDALWKRDNWQDVELDGIVAGIPPSVFLETMIKAYQMIDLERRERLDELLSNWLVERSYTKELEKIALIAEIGNPEDVITLHWLKLAGVDISSLIASEQQFYRAYLCNDDLHGYINLYIFYFIDRQQRHVRGLSLTFDRNPPWVGAVRDANAYSSRSPESAITKLIFDRHQGTYYQIRLLSPDSAREKAIEALEFNRSQDIRLPRSLVKCRNEFERFVLSLPKNDKTPDFSLVDFDRLTHIGQNPEKIIQHELEQKQGITKKGQHQFIPSYLVRP
jgi:hypothetical protein